MVRREEEERKKKEREKNVGKGSYRAGRTKISLPLSSIEMM